MKLKFSLHYIVQDIRKQIHELATSVYQIRGHIKGKTLLPFPQVSDGVLAYSQMKLLKIWRMRSDNQRKSTIKRSDDHR